MARAVIKYIKEGLVCGLLVVVIGLGLRVYKLIDNLDVTIQALPKLVDDRATSLQQDLGLQADDTRALLKQEIDAIRADVNGKILKTIDDRLASIQSDANNQLSAFNGNLTEQTALLNKNIAETLAPVKSSADQVSTALPDFLDCQQDDFHAGNKNCLYIRYGDLSSSLDRTLSAVAQAAPDMVKSADKIAASSVSTSDSIAATGIEVKKAARRFNQPQTKWQQFRTWLTFTARIGSYF